jgi:two-component system, response regulator PdtaR
MARDARILLAEDEAVTALAVSVLLREVGYTVCALATTAPEVIDLVEQHRPDLALVDVRLAQHTSGLSAAQDILQRWGIPSVLLSGHITRHQAREAGAVALVRKPFTDEQLLWTVDFTVRWLREPTIEGAIPPGFLGWKDGRD